MVTLCYSIYRNNVNLFHLFLILNIMLLYWHNINR
nr:MAG TPA: hypothetical protein [Caudoviricetes sp.]